MTLLNGIGKRCETGFAAQGMKLVIADIEDSALASAVAGLKASGAEAIGVRCDVTSPQSVAELADWLAQACEVERGLLGPDTVLR